MKYYVGIDLGTTNSAICWYDGDQVRVCRSPEQSDVTPSAIYVDRRGRRYYGRRAYELAPSNEQNAATLFKRYMGTSKTFTFEAAGVTLRPEECSAEILRVLYGYLPSQVREDPETATVITVPAAFNQVKKDATLEAARLAGIGRVALMQEPVAAVMSVTQRQRGDRAFLIYDLGGGTFDISVAQNLGGRVNLLVQGGKEMCGGRDWDRLIYARVVKPWLEERFTLTDEVQARRVHRLALLAAEQAKIELSSEPETAIRMDEERMNAVDANGREVYLDIPFNREQLDGLIAELVDETVEVTRDVLNRAGLQASEVAQLVFVGGPSCYAPLREKVTGALGIGEGVSVNPMTAVAEGAAVYAEAVDWSDEQHHRKQAFGEKGLGEVRIKYESRTVRDVGRVAFTAQADRAFSVEITSEDTGWVSGRTPVHGRAIIEVPLMKRGENRFRVAAYDEKGMPLSLPDDSLVITRTLATVNAIPASHPIAVKVLDQVGGKPVPVYLVEENDPLPKRGEVTLRAGRSLAAGSDAALVFTLWEGGIQEPIEDNRYIGTYRIPGTSFYGGVIPVGAEILCEYEMNESGTLHLGVSVPSVGVNLSERNFYSRAEGTLNLEDAPRLIRDANRLLRRINEIGYNLDDPEVNQLRGMVLRAKDDAEAVDDPEMMQSAYDDLLDCRKRLARLKQRNARRIREADLRKAEGRFDNERAKATPGELAEFESLRENARFAMDHGGDITNQLQQIDQLVNAIRWRQDDIIRSYFRYLITTPSLFGDRAEFDRLRAQGVTLLENGDIDGLRSVVSSMNRQINATRAAAEAEDIGENMYEDVNVTRS